MRRKALNAAGGFAACLAISVFGTGSALAISAGCQSVQNGNFNFAGGTVTGVFDAGDQLSYTIVTNYTGPGPAPVFTFSGSLAAGGGPTGGLQAVNTFTGTVAATAGSGSLNLTALTGSINSTVTCTPVATPATGPTNSQILDQTIQTLSQVAAQTSSQAMGDATSGAIGDAFGDGGTTQFANGSIRTSLAAIENAANADGKDKKSDPFESFNALGYAKAPYLKAVPREQTPWHIWIDGRYTGFDDKGVTNFDGWQTNVTAGASYRFTQNFLAGALIGYENFKYSLTAVGVPASLRGDGVSGGGYFGWKFYERLRLDGMLTYGRIDYAGAAGAVTGSFGADRITGMTKLSGRYGFGTYYIEPASMLTIASERQDSFVDTAAVAHNPFNFTVGRSSTGGTIGTPLAWGQCIVTPTFGAFGDYRFGDQTLAATNVVPTFNNGWSAHVNGGLNFAMPGNVTASIGGERGGLGDTIQYWRATAKVGVPF